MSKKAIFFTLLLFFAVSTSAYSQAVDTVRTQQPQGRSYPDKKARGLTSFSNVFIPKGTWITGIGASYSTHVNDNYSLTVINGINSVGHGVEVYPMFGYSVRENMILGAKFGYSRHFLRVDNAGLSIGDESSGVSIELNSYYSLEHSYQGIIFLRQYIPFGSNKRFAMFVEGQVMLGGKQAKFAAHQPVKGTYQTGLVTSLTVTPGLVAFVTNHFAMELNVGILGLKYSSMKQVHNQVDTGHITDSDLSFRINLLSIGLGLAFYI